VISPEPDPHCKDFSFTAWLCHEWRAIVFVAVVVAIAHYSEWLNVVDVQPFLAIGNLTAAFVAIAPGELTSLADARVVVLEIDSERYDKKYHARSPLDRCQLLSDLGAIYAANPRLLVIDIDLSPALWLMMAPGTDSTGQLKCENDLKSLIKKSSEKGIKTVLMRPFPLSDADTRNRPSWDQKLAWQKELTRSPNVTFGDPEIEAVVNLVLKGHAGPGSLVGAAYAALDNPSLCEKADLHRHENRLRINPRTYRGRGGVYIAPVAKMADSGDAKDKLTLEDKIVFFGAAYGSQEDTYLTPVGEIYGVEVHAAALLTRYRRLHEFFLFDLVADLVFAFVFGVTMACCWDRYACARGAAGRSGPTPVDATDTEAIRETASLWALALTGVAIALVLVSFTISIILLVKLDVWASPLPLMAGMLIDTIVSRWRETPEKPAAHPAESSGGWRYWVLGGSRTFWARHRWAAAFVLARHWLWMLAVGCAVAIVIHDWPSCGFG
jgi:CHASE2 domain-containing sensor protein